jgi:monoamine oxidase
MTGIDHRANMPDSSGDAFDVLVVGAGVSGLAVLGELDRAGLHVVCVEARDRIGGRIFSVRDSFCPLPVELGAEFVHGRSPVLWSLLTDARAAIYEASDDFIHVRAGKRDTDDQVASGMWRLMDEVKAQGPGGPDQTFAEFCRQSTYPAEVKQRAESYVEGFNAARSEVIGVASLAKDARAADQIEGDRSFRVLGGYDSVPRHLLNGVAEFDRKLRLNSVVKSVDWQRGSVVTTVRSSTTGSVDVYRSRSVVITVPLGVLHAEANQQGAIEFRPKPQQTLDAARRLAFGQVFRVVLRFDQPFWEQNPDLMDAGFILSDERFFPTWWTPLPVRAPFITGWSASRHADGLLGNDKSQIVEKALASLAHITRLQPSRLEQAYFQDWHADPFARGAYSYVPAGALPAREVLATPVEDTLYFTGEATDLGGHSATVHGALGAGQRTAGQVLAAARNWK